MGLITVETQLLREIVCLLFLVSILERYSFCLCVNNVVKCYLCNLVDNKIRCWFFQCIWVHYGVVCVAVSSLMHMSTGSCRSQCSSYLEPRWEEHCVIFIFSLSGCFQCLCFSYFSASVPLPPFIFLRYHSVTGAQMSLCGGSWLGFRDC